MTRVRPIIAGFALGLFAIAAHVVWSLLMLLGWAQPITGFIFRPDLPTPAFRVASFEWATAGGLLADPAAAGFIFGLALASWWNGSFRLAVREPVRRSVFVH